MPGVTTRHTFHCPPWAALVNKTVLVIGAVVTAPMLLIAPMAMAVAGAHSAEAACKRQRGWRR